MPAIRLDDAEYLARRERFLATIGERGATALVTFSPNNVCYFSRFTFIATERPIGHVLTADRSLLFIPNLEQEHAAAEGLIDDLIVYPEYPGERPPLEYLRDALLDLGLGSATIAVDGDGYGQIYGYRGPKLSELLPDATIVDVNDEIEAMQMINSPAELDLIRESARWGHVAHELLQEYSRVGEVESEIAQRATTDASSRMLEALGPEFRARSAFGPPAFAGFGGAVGAASALPHALSNNARLAAGDVLVTWAASMVWGYTSELERTMILGEPTPEQERFFNHMLAAQTLAIEAIKPGVPCFEIDRVTIAYYEEHGLMPYRRHHTGHAISQLMHEAPFLDIGDERLIEPGMVFTVEPGLYVPGFAGFRHSDTVAVTDSGVEWITTYPRDLERLTIPV